MKVEKSTKAGLYLSAGLWLRNNWYVRDMCM